MNVTGFRLRKLQISGENVLPAKVEFSPGLNVITAKAYTRSAGVFVPPSFNAKKALFCSGQNHYYNSKES